jgi:hypothetical protein
MMARPSRFASAAAIVLALTLLPASVHAGGPGPAAERVAVLDAGSFIVVEAHGAKLGEVLDRIAARLKAELVINTTGLPLDRTIDGRTRGTVAEVLRWLVPGFGFVLIFDQPQKGDSRPPKLVRIWLTKPGERGVAAVVDAAAGKPAEAAKWKATPEEGAKGKATTGKAPSRTAASVSAGATGPGKRSRSSSADVAAGKSDIPSTPKSEIMSVAEQLQAQTPQAQLAIEAAARNPARQGPPPAFLAPQSDATQLSLQQQTERSQALAVEQLRRLMDAYKAACGGTGQGGGQNNPC